MLVAGGFCYVRLLDESSIARESQNSPDSLWGRVVNLRASDRLLSIGSGRREWRRRRSYELCDTFRRAGRSRRLGECLDRPLHFVRVRPAREVEADHLEGPLGGLAACVQHAQQTGDDAAVHLNLNAVLLGG